jgi:hypothetical protein
MIFARPLLVAGLAGFALWPLSSHAQDAAAAPAAPRALAAPATSAVPVARVRVVRPYLDMHSGPGRGFPIFYAAEKNEWVVIELRHTDWFKVRTARGPVGWVSREQMAGTVTEDGVPFELADPTLQDFLNRRFDVGIGYGATQKTAFTRLWVGWRFSDTLTGSQPGHGADQDLHWAVDGQPAFRALVRQAASLFVGIGVGRFNFEPNKSLVNNEQLDGNLGVFTLGARYHLSGRVALRIDYSRYAVFVSDFDSRSYQAGSVGLSLHF